jgi:four helix bundle protein
VDRQRSLKETATHLLLAQMIGITEKADVQPILEMCEEEGKMLAALIRSLECDTK